MATFMGYSIVKAKRAGMCKLSGKRYLPGAQVIWLQGNGFGCWALDTPANRIRIEQEVKRFA